MHACISIGPALATIRTCVYIKVTPGDILASRTRAKSPWCSWMSWQRVGGAFSIRSLFSGSASSAVESVEISQQSSRQPCFGRTLAHARRMFEQRSRTTLEHPSGPGPTSTQPTTKDHVMHSALTRRHLPVYSEFPPNPNSLPKHVYPR